MKFIYYLRENKEGKVTHLAMFKKIGHKYCLEKGVTNIENDFDFNPVNMIEIDLNEYRGLLEKNQEDLSPKSN